MNQSLEVSQSVTGATAEAAIQQLIEQLSLTWDKGDADAFAALFSEEADYVVFDGTHLKGRQAIADAHRPLFEKFMKGSKLVGQGATIRFLTPEIALIHSRGAVLLSHQKQVSRRRISVQTLVAVKQKEDGAWRFVAFQNTRYRPFNQTLVGKVLTRLASRKSN